MHRFRHIILTRFNVRIEGGEPPSPEWLEHRLDFFERFCLPSVRAQTNTNFDWIVYCHPEMPESIRQRISACRAWCHFRPVFFRSSFGQSMVQASISELVPGFTHLITTRLDNDDAVSKTFVETIQNRFNGQEFEFLNFTTGYIWRQGKLYAGRHTSNAFISLVERTANYSTVYCGNHMELHRVGPITQISEPAGWIQVVHDRNLLNCVWGQPHDVEEIYQTFGVSAETLSTCC
jgi:hypothetical protein